MIDFKRGRQRIGKINTAFEPLRWVLTQGLLQPLGDRSLHVDDGRFGNDLDAELQFASRLRAYNLEVADAIVEVSGASSAKVNVNNTLEMEEGLASDIDYRGNPHVIKRD